MRRPALFLAPLLIAGCLGNEPAEDGAPAEVVAASAQPEPAAPANETEAPAVAIAIPILLDGNTGTSAVVCVLGPVGECVFQEAAPGTSGLLIEGQAGTVTGGELTLAWSASSPATNELSMGAMLMDGGEGCEGVDLGMVRGASPLVLTLATAAPRALCEGEILHLWIAGTNWGGQDPAYYQVDVDQAFHVEGTITIAA